MENLIG